MSRITRRTTLRAGLGALVGVASVGALTACSDDPNSIAAQAQSGDRKGYISGDGTIERLAPEERGEPVKLEGTTLEGTPWNLADVAGKVVVLNVWGSWCPPCITETPDLQKVWSDLEAARAPVAFVGLNKMESPETGLAFQEANQVTYPSLAYDGGVPLLSLQGRATATPTTLVLDRQARIAARASGAVSASILRGLVDDVLAEA